MGSEYIVIYINIYILGVLQYILGVLQYIIYIYYIWGPDICAWGHYRPYWTLGRKDSRALDTRPVGH